MSVESCDQTCSMSSTNGPNSREAASCQRMSMEEVSKGDSSIRDLKMDLDKYSTTPDTESTPTVCAEDSGYPNACTPPVFFLQLANSNILALLSNIQGQVPTDAPWHRSTYLRKPIGALNEGERSNSLTSIQ